jgi:hypothetical protein
MHMDKLLAPTLVVANIGVDIDVRNTGLVDLCLCRAHMQIFSTASS